jgi:uncharacterized OB-fold protein
MTYPQPTATKPTSRNLPDITAPATSDFWEAAKRHVLVAQKCNGCGSLRYPPTQICPNCWSTDQSWAEIAPTGEVYSYVVYHRALDPSMKDDLPYVIGRVVTDEGVIFTVRLDVEPEVATVGMRVTASWDDITDDVTLLRFTAA